MNGDLVLCAGCNRHVYAEESSCPFCHRAPMGGVAGKAMVVALSAGLSLAGCRGPEGPAALYGAPPQPPLPQPTSSATAAPTQTAPAVDPGRTNVPMYGKPPMPAPQSK